jgi:hypothetical protein
MPLAGSPASLSSTRRTPASVAASVGSFRTMAAEPPELQGIAETTPAMFSSRSRNKRRA